MERQNRDQRPSFGTRERRLFMDHGRGRSRLLEGTAPPDRIPDQRRSATIGMGNSREISHSHWTFRKTLYDFSSRRNQESANDSGAQGRIGDQRQLGQRASRKERSPSERDQDFYQLAAE